ncbi:hypothetical protein [Sutcliffiella horikoshii]|uniref:hypothetical protein n=1 Tax=Sutcliffiella horikoshii TaxID=79883 RepID=UPI0021CC8283|nr:hypothetical protein [Sutcliffiella horikoshii]
MIVNKPQFDENILSEGTAIQVTTNRGWEAVNNSYQWNGIVVAFSPLLISVARYNPEMSDDMDIVDIKIEEVSKKHNPVTIKLLIPVTEEEKECQLT